MRRRRFAVQGCAVPELWEGRSILKEAAAALQAWHPGRLLAVGDGNTLAAANASLPAIELPGTPRADDRYANLILEKIQTESPEALVAIGSGTINDLCKYVAHECGIPYAVIATAPSMNGYASANASMTVNGFKTTLPCTAPGIVVADWEVLAAAPRRMIAAGFADALCRCTAQSDWLLSHRLLGTPYRPDAFEMQAAVEEAVISHASDLAVGKPKAVGLLMEWLLLGGVAMNLAGGSYPASQGEHLIAHACEMMGLAPDALHGELVALGTLAAAEHQGKMIEKESILFNEMDDSIHLMMQRRMGQEAAASCLAAHDLKQLRMQAVEPARLRWKEMTGELGRLARRPTAIRDLLNMAGAPTRPEDIGISVADFTDAKTAAPFLRDRFTFLDLA